ncbi:MAG: metal ABC transporter permease [Neisseriaceae bacterium]
MLYYYLVQPFADYHFMRIALLAIIYQSISVAPIGLFLVMRRMSLMGDALSHAILPGVAISFLIAGFNPVLMSIGGLLTGCIMMYASRVATEKTHLQEDANFAGFYLTCLAVGVILVSRYGSNTELLNFLFGSLFQINFAGLAWIAATASLTLVILMIIYRPLYVESLEVNFLSRFQMKSRLIVLIFQTLTVFNLVSGFQTLGTLLSVGLMMIPAISAKLWFSRMETLLAGTFCFALLSGIIGLLLSYHFDLPSGAMIILCAGLFYLTSLFLAPHSWVKGRGLTK